MRTLFCGSILLLSFLVTNVAPDNHGNFNHSIHEPEAVRSRVGGTPTLIALLTLVLPPVVATVIAADHNLPHDFNSDLFWMGSDLMSIGEMQE